MRKRQEKFPQPGQISYVEGISAFFSLKVENFVSGGLYLSIFIAKK